MRKEFLLLHKKGRDRLIISSFFHFAIKVVFLYDDSKGRGEKLC